MCPGAVHLNPETDCTAPMKIMMNTLEKNKEAYFPAVYHEEIDDGEPFTQFDDIRNVPPAKRNLYWSKRSSKPCLVSPPLSMMSSLNTLNSPDTKRSLYWSKRSQQFPPLPFSTIVRNGNQKRSIYWSKRSQDKDFGDFLPFSTIIRRERNM